MSATRRAVPALIVTLVAFGLYRRTLLPGLDLGDTASLQGSAGSLLLTPRDGYPLYFALANLFVWMMPTEPAYALNVASAVCGAVACGTLAWIAIDVTGSSAAALVSGLLLASSYTLWTQAIIAEVYALHVLMIGLSLAALLAWHRRPTLERLALFCGMYAVGFGNHLSMILLLPGYAVFVGLAAPGGLRTVLRPRTLGVGGLIAGLGALQYVWNFRNLLHMPGRPAGGLDLLAAFWFDVTRADWRASLVLGIPLSRVADRIAMYWFDVRQQFGAAGAALTLAGTIYLLRRQRSVALLLLLLYFVNTAFAFTYNVGDTHVFYLPSHFIMALLAGAGVAMIVRLPQERRWRSSRIGWVFVLGLLLYPVWRILDTLPAVDRSTDWRATDGLNSLTRGLTGHNTLFLADLNWQWQNALAYYGKYRRPDLAYVQSTEVALHLPTLVRDNEAIGRRVALTAQSRARVLAAYGGLYDVVPDPLVPVPALNATIRQLPPGTPYVLTLLAPLRDSPIDQRDLDTAVDWLTAGRLRHLVTAGYTTLVGRVGDPPAQFVRSARPYRTAARAGGIALEIRMESWLADDTIRRAGFGHVVANRRHALTVERGASFVALTLDGRPQLVAYAGGLFAPQPRYLLISHPLPIGSAP